MLHHLLLQGKVPEQSCANRGVMDKVVSAESRKGWGREDVTGDGIASKPAESLEVDVQMMVG